MSPAGAQLSTMTTASAYDVLVVGAGHAGAQTADYPKYAIKFCNPSRLTRSAKGL